MSLSLTALQAFGDELCKIAVTLQTLRRVSKKIPFTRAGDVIHHPWLPPKRMARRTAEGAAKYVRPVDKTHKAEVLERARRYTKLFGPDPDIAEDVAKMRARERLMGPKGRIFLQGDQVPRILPKAVAKKLTPQGREAFNRSVLLHEGSEAGKHFGGRMRKETISLAPFKQRTYKGDPRSFASHLSTRPMLQDLNIAATLKGPGSEAAEGIRELRKAELAQLQKYIPDLHRLNLGKQRISRHAQKRLQQLYENPTKAVRRRLSTPEASQLANWERYG